jgi:arylsulfatase A-like enzyme
VLRQRGYATAGFYSWLAFEPAYSGLQRGFDSYVDLTVNLPDYLVNPRSATLAATYKRLKTLLTVPSILDRQFAASADVEEVLDGKGDVTADAVTIWLQEYASGGNAGQPFFVWIHMWDPHYPFTPPAAYQPAPSPDCVDCPDGSMATVRALQNGMVLNEAQSRHLTAYYDGEVSFMDAELGRILTTLEQLGFMDHTFITLMGDHGESFGELGRWFHGTDLYQVEVHVPLLMRFPGTIPAGQYFSTVTSSIDVFPTILNVLDVPRAARVDGESLAPMFRSPTSRPRVNAFSELNDRRLVSLVDEDWQLVKDTITGQLRLYRAGGQRLDERNYADTEPGVAQELAQRVDSWMAAYP